MKMQFVLFCGCLATRIVDVHIKSEKEITVITRIYRRPADKKIEINHSSVEYFKITKQRANCNEHFPVNSLPHHCEACGNLL